MELIVGNSYIICFDINGTNLTFHCKIISSDDIFVTFIDKYGKILSYRKSNIVSYEEVKE